MTSPAQRVSDAAHLGDLDRQEAITAEVNSIMSRGKFCSAPDELLFMYRKRLHTISLAFVLMEALTTTVLQFQEMLDLAKSISDA